jgi:hypothetical protein
VYDRQRSPREQSEPVEKELKALYMLTCAASVLSSDWCLTIY